MGTIQAWSVFGIMIRQKLLDFGVRNEVAASAQDYLDLVEGGGHSGAP